MSRSIQPVSRERHGAMQWLRFKNLAFAAKSAVAPVALSELLAAARAMPLGFVEIEGETTLCALLGLRAAQNLFVGRDGRWLGQHVPLVFQFHPFSLGETADGSLQLCVDEASGLIAEATDSDGELRFFDAQGALTPPARTLLDQLGTAHRGMAAACRATRAIVANGLLESWPVSDRDEAGADRPIKGIRRISETALNALPAAELSALRDSGGLAAAYCQMFSGGNIATLAKLAAAGREAASRPAATPKYAYTPKEDDTLKIDWATFLKD